MPSVVDYIPTLISTIADLPIEELDQGKPAVVRYLAHKSLGILRSWSPTLDLALTACDLAASGFCSQKIEDELSSAMNDFLDSTGIGALLDAVIYAYQIIPTPVKTALYSIKASYKAISAVVDDPTSAVATFVRDPQGMTNYILGTVILAANASVVGLQDQARDIVYDVAQSMGAGRASRLIAMGIVPQMSPTLTRDMVSSMSSLAAGDVTQLSPLISELGGQAYELASGTAGALSDAGSAFIDLVNPFD